MTREEKRKWLYRYKDACDRVKSLTEERDSLMEMAVHITPSLTGMPSSHNSGSDKIPKAYEAIQDVLHKIDAETERMNAVREEICAAIETLEDRRLQNVLRFHFINGYSFEVVAEKMNYSVRGVLYMYDRATDKIFIDLHS